MNEKTAESATALTSLIGPFEVFLREYWNTRPMVHHTGLAEEWQRMLSLDELDFILAYRCLREPYVRVSMNGAPVHEKRYMRPHAVNGTPVRGVLDVDKLAMEFASNASILLDSIDRYLPAVKRLCQGVGAALRGPAEAVVFLTPGGVRGLSPHFDSTEVFVLQIYGSKRWKVFDQIRPLPASGRVLRPDEVSKPALEVRTQPGDCLYVPWGCPHVAVSAESTSCHISIQVRPPTWGELIENLIESALKPAEYEPVDLFSASSAEIPVGQAELRLRAATNRLVSCDLGEFIDGRIAAQDPVPASRAGFLQQIASSAGLLPGSRVSRNKRMTECEIGSLGEDRVQLKVESLTLAYPARALGTLTALLDADDKPVSEFAAELGLDATLKLVRHLVANSVLISSDGSRAEEEGR